MRPCVLGLVSFLALAHSTPALAQPDDYRFELSFFAGRSFLNAETFGIRGLDALFPDFPLRIGSGSFEGGFEFGARFGYRMHPRATLEAEYRFAPDNELNRSEIALLGLERLGGRLRGGLPLRPEVIQAVDLRSFLLPVSETVPSHAVATNLLYDLVSGKLSPFLSAGLGAQIFDLAGERNRTHFSWNLGGGVKWRLRPGLAARVDARESFITDFFATGKTESAFNLQIGLVVGF